MTGFVPAFPASLQSPEAARPGPDIDGTAVRPGDVLTGPNGQSRVVAGTGFGPGNDRLALFDPAATERCARRGEGTHLDTDAWTLAHRALGVETTTGAETRYLFVASQAPDSGACRCAWGRTPLGATYVPVESTLTRPTPAALRATLDAPPEELATAAANVEDTPLTSLSGRVETASETRLADTASVPASALSTTVTAIPTGAETPVCTDPVTLAPGDRLLTWPDGAPPATPLSADPTALAAGRCLVVLRASEGAGVDCFGLAGEGRQTLSPATLAERYERASEGGVVLKLLARSCFVDPVGTEETYSVHCYAADGDGTPPVVLAAARQERATPHLEHPLTLPCTGFETPEALASALRVPESLSHPLGTWARTIPKVAALCERVGARITEAGR